MTDRTDAGLIELKNDNALNGNIYGLTRLKQKRFMFFINYGFFFISFENR